MSFLIKEPIFDEKLLDNPLATSGNDFLRRKVSSTFKKISSWNLLKLRIRDNFRK